MLRRQMDAKDPEQYRWWWYVMISYDIMMLHHDIAPTMVILVICHIDSENDANEKPSPI